MSTANDFQANWGFIEQVAKDENFKGYVNHRITADGFFDSTRDRYKVEYLNRQGRVIETRAGMKLRSKAGKDYFVARRAPPEEPISQ